MKVGILGAGQLAQMLILAGQPLGLEFYLYAPEANSTTQSLAPTTIGNYTDLDILNRFTARLDRIIYESENIPSSTIAYLENQTVTYPKASILACAQDRLLEKNLFRHLNIPTAPYYAIQSKQGLHAIIEKIPFPFRIKSRKGGYDGKNQAIIKHQDDLDALTTHQCHDAIVEAHIDFDREVSIIAARNKNKDIVFYDLCENYHQGGILRTTQNKPNDPLFEQAKAYLLKIVEHFNYIGVFTLECFVQNQILLANEMAPRVHNSGHWTIEGAETSQFENHLRAGMELELGPTTSLGYSTMINCIGQLPDNLAAIKTIPNLFFHDYFKQPKHYRKLGHMTYITKQKLIIDSKNSDLFSNTKLREYFPQQIV